MADENLHATVSGIIDAAMKLFAAAIAPLVEQAVQILFAPGGAIHSQIVADSLSAAGKWYGMYTPQYYKRGYTFTQRENIVVNLGSVTVDGLSWKANWNVINASPHAKWSDGFKMKNGYRPGGYIVANGGEYSADIDIDAGAAMSIFMRCVQQVVGVI